MSRWLIVGHRGVGKSSFLSSLSKTTLSKKYKIVSLDQCIEEHQGQSISKIFSEKGESFFRKIEEETLFNLCEKNESLIVDVGAGYLGPKPEGTRGLWLTRNTDPRTSYFLDRPLLDGAMGLSEERFDQRQKQYQKLADFRFEMRESFIGLSQSERDFFAALFLSKDSSSLDFENWYLTYKNSMKQEKLDFLAENCKVKIEYRDDLIEFSEIQMLENRLVSFRKSQPESFGTNEFWDWPLEWGQNPDAPVLSFHKRTDDLENFFSGLPETDQILKVAIPINDFEELRKGHEWRMQKPNTRCFLPMSKSGRWHWYRLLHSQNSPINFLRLDDGSANDQPSFLQVLNFEPKFQTFAAVLGSPVNHSLTPSFHSEFFRNKKANVFAIDVNEDEFEQAIGFLSEIGLKWAAVTSPLKFKAAELVSSSQKALNTLFFDGQNWYGKNTDPEGLSKLLSQEIPQPVVVWGGGGTLGSLEQSLDECFFYSSRTGEPKGTAPSKPPQSLIWAVGARNFSKKGVYPPKDWPISKVFDLNYSTDSPGILSAHSFSCQYASGLAMFEGQAVAQQEFWNECER